MLLNNIREKILNNGFKIIALRKPGAPIVAVQLWYKTGSVHEHDGIRGISHVVEHMMFRGSQKIKTEEHAKRINDVGGHCNAFTTEDSTVFTNSVPSDCLEMVFSLEADRMDGLLFDENLFEIERKVIIEEYHTYMNNPVGKAFLEFRSEFFRGHPYATGPLGTITDLEALTAEQCRNYYSAWYRPDNAVLVVVGDIAAESTLDQAEQHFTSKKPGAAVRVGVRDDRADQTTAPTVHRMKRIVDFDVPLLVVGYPGPSSSHEDAVALEILQLVIAGGESSRLHREVVRRQSIAVMVGGMNHLLQRAGMSMFLAAFTPDVSVARVERAFAEQITLVCTNGISEAEMEKVKNATLTSRTFELYTAENICQRIGFSEVVEGDYRLWVERFATLEKLDTERLVTVARRYWNDAHRHILHLQPRKTSPLLYIMGFIRRFTGKRG